MARVSEKLSAPALEGLPSGKHPDGDGLWLYKRENGSARWVLRFFFYGKRQEMGIGSYKPKGRGLSLSLARKEAAKWRAMAEQGLNPITERERRRREAQNNLHTLKDVTMEAFEARKAELKGDGKSGRWLSPLEIHVLPKLGRVPVAEITQIDIKNTLAPIWHTKADTARKAMNRLGIVFQHAAALGMDVDMQVTQKARALLGKSRHKAKSIPSLPWQEVPAFYASLTDGSTTHLALRLLILTGLRSAPIRFARLEEIDGETWTVPAERMKGRLDKTSDFRVPLSTDAMDIVEDAIKLSRDGYLFPSVRKGVISDATMSALMKRRGMDARPHGFRSSFRNWAEDVANASELVAETALAHTVGSKVSRDYRTTDVFEKRRALMQAWADHVADRAGHVVKMVAS